MSGEVYYLKYRPKLFKHVIGQPEAVEMLNNLYKREELPHALLFTGPSGCGKTTLARILCGKLGCEGGDLFEKNSSSYRGIDTIREINRAIHLAPINGQFRVWVMDECQGLSKDAQSAFLKTLEDTPGHVFFMLATTDPLKLLPAIRTRCTEIKVRALTKTESVELQQMVCKKEGLEISEDVLGKIADCSEGSPRKALVLLHQVSGMSNEESMMEAVESADSKAEAILIARALLNPRAKWGDVAKVLKDVKEEPESLRQMVLAYATNVMLGCGKMSERAAFISDCFRENFYDTKRNGLVLACWEVVKGV